MTRRRRPMTRPFVTANFAATWDGRVSTRQRTPVDFPSRYDKRRLLEIRASNDAVLVGAGTVVADNMAIGLPAEDLRRTRIGRGEAPYPFRIIVSNSGKLDPGLKVFRTSAGPLHIFSTKRMPRRLRLVLAEHSTLHLAEGDTVQLPAMLKTLTREYGVRRLVCEGGPTLFRALLIAELVDEIHLTLCPAIFGSETAPTITGPAGDFLPKSILCSLRAMERVGDECFLRYRIGR